METSSQAGTHDTRRAAQELAEQLKTFIRRRAEEALTLPVHQRDTHFAKVHAAAMYLATEHGRAEGEASAWALKIVLLTRDMVQALEGQSLTLASRLKVVIEQDRVEAERDA
ncbi:MAG TPA: hypothetical protein VGN97_22505 [Mesorhizobium sp.]|jgi:hypothetical protein|nr:hypothetical protein [Mesorhizobium sp.]